MRVIENSSTVKANRNLVITGLDSWESRCDKNLFNKFDGEEFFVSQEQFLEAEKYQSVDLEYVSYK